MSLSLLLKSRNWINLNFYIKYYCSRCYVKKVLWNFGIEKQINREISLSVEANENKSCNRYLFRKVKQEKRNRISCNYVFQFLPASTRTMNPTSLQTIVIYANEIYAPRHYKLNLIKILSAAENFSTMSCCFRTFSLKMKTRLHRYDREFSEMQNRAPHEILWQA